MVEPINLFKNWTWKLLKISMVYRKSITFLLGDALLSNTKNTKKNWRVEKFTREIWIIRFLQVKESSWIFTEDKENVLGKLKKQLYETLLVDQTGAFKADDMHIKLQLKSRRNWKELLKENSLWPSLVNMLIVYLLHLQKREIYYNILWLEIKNIQGNYTKRGKKRYVILMIKRTLKRPLNVFLGKIYEYEKLIKHLRTSFVHILLKRSFLVTKLMYLTKMTLGAYLY